MPNVFCESCRLILPQGTLSATSWLVHSNSDGTLQICPGCADSLEEHERRSFRDRGMLNGEVGLSGDQAVPVEHRVDTGIPSGTD